MPASTGLLLEDVESGFVGEVVAVSKVAGEMLMTLEGRGGVRRRFPLGPGFWIDGEPVNITPPQKTRVSSEPERTASGSIKVAAKPAVMLPSRMWVEGRHDWQLIDRVWGEDLRLEGIAVEELAGVDRLMEMLATFEPGPGRRAGVLVDHLLPGTKERRLVDEALAEYGNEHVLVLGHPYVDVWQAIKPARVGLGAWPHIPKGTDIKAGTLAALGLPHSSVEDIGIGWSKILARVRDWRDLEPSLLGRVEELIDFLTHN
ncbi:DUF3097 family protein [Flaviflexus huanghaiensis]|uniref:DUF3097 family protein n=1 Tax=Flaviflexus huanghaiensis TaxID=1111473 RepID=UPI003BAD0A9F